jgi:hypothetical protein
MKISNPFYPNPQATQTIQNSLIGIKALLEEVKPVFQNQAKDEQLSRNISIAIQEIEKIC